MCVCGGGGGGLTKGIGYVTQVAIGCHSGHEMCSLASQLKVLRATALVRDMSNALYVCTRVSPTHLLLTLHAISLGLLLNDF